ncbi:hypothetical protein ACIOD1_22420 [Streptomyces sp. NPDC088097]|uniref:hypothetical protein n=1 Tax=Streptomyces sp. NPDC088097 TaxID=3365823 RepID=UPI00380C66C8
MDTRTRYRFLLDGPGDVLRNQRTLYLKPEGVFFGIRTLQRPCEPQEVAVTRFRVVTRAEVQKDRKTGQTYDLSFAYEALGVRKFTVGAGDGLVGDSRPPAPTACEGTLSVLHLGDEIKKGALPEQLDFRHSGSTSADGGATSVKVAGDLVLDAQFLPPTAPDTCKG